jgi:hypothetical protein
MSGLFPVFGAVDRLLRHRWNDQLVRRVLPDVALQRLTTRIAASEQQHTGQIRLCAEGGLPWSYLLRNAPARERALMMFIADRGIHAHVGAAEWQKMVARMSQAFRAAI